jgi:ankyrin repeat protein
VDEAPAEHPQGLVEVEVLVWLLEQGLDVNAIDSYGETVLTRAAGWSRPEIVRMLLDYGADATLRTHDGRIAADFAADNPDIDRTNVYWRLNDARFE